MRYHDNCGVQMIVIHLISLTMPTQPALCTIAPRPHLNSTPCLLQSDYTLPGEVGRVFRALIDNTMCTLCNGLCPGADELQSSTMFRNTYQSGFLSILYSIG